MASINDLATAATIASSAVALQDSSSPTGPTAVAASSPEQADHEMGDGEGEGHGEGRDEDEHKSPKSPSASAPAPAPASESEPAPAPVAAAAPTVDSPVAAKDSPSPPSPPPPPPAAGAVEQTQAPAPAPAPRRPSSAEAAPAPPVPAPAPQNSTTPVLAAPQSAAQIPVLSTAGPLKADVGAGTEARREPVRGAFVVFEGLDRAGKTTQAKLLQQRCVESGKGVRFFRFPDRSTPIGQMIDAYLKGQAEIEDHVIHLLFSANRWEAANKIQAELAAGHTVVCDRFYHSGIVYSAAKQLPSLSLSWARAPEAGLPRPDVVLFLDLEETVARARGGWGGEVYEKGEMQRRVRELFWGLSMGDVGTKKKQEQETAGASEEGEGRNQTPKEEPGEFRQEQEDIVIVDADLDVEKLAEKVWETARPRIEAVERGEVGKTVRVVR